MSVIDQEWESSRPLTCPNCRGEYLHHGRVEIFNRGEDEPTGFHARVEFNSVQCDTTLTDNPSRRRSGLRIWLTCEGCAALSVLELDQHKGQTFLVQKVWKLVL